MNERVIKVMESICHNPKLVQEIYEIDREYYFRVKGHVMSIVRRLDEGEENYLLWVYPGDHPNLKDLANRLSYESENVPMATFRSAENSDSTVFAQLYRLLENRYLNIDVIFDEIIGPLN